MATQFNTQFLGNELKAIRASLNGSPLPMRSNTKVALVDPRFSPESAKKADNQYQNTKVFEGFYNNNPSIPKIIVSSPNGTQRTMATGPRLEATSPSEEYTPEKTKQVYGNTPKPFRSTKVVYPPSVIPVRQYIGGVTTTYIKIDYLKRHPDDALYICGNGPDMSWHLDEALPLHYVGDDRWIYETHQDFKEFEYRLVLNKKIWQVHGGIVNKDHNKSNPQNVTPLFM